MPPVLAATLCLLFSGTLLVWDARHRREVSGAVWIPTLWLFVLGSRPVSQWLNLGAPVDDAAGALLEGSPTDRWFFLALIAAAFAVLVRRRLQVAQFARRNGWFVAFMAYCLVSVIWSDYPFVSFKRWFKALGDPLIVLVLLSERHPAAAIMTVMRRCAFVLLPLSILFIKYFPELGRAYSFWTGAAYYTGVTTNKNMLGYLLFVYGLMFICTLAERRHFEGRLRRGAEVIVSLMFLAIIAWLFKMADSKTPFVALIVAGSVAVAARSAFIRAHIGVMTVVLLLAAWTLLGSEVGNYVIAALGRDPSLTGRTDLWEAVLPMTPNPILGAGFESFWLGPRLAVLWEQFAFKPNQAHNGYIDIYLNLGLVGLALFVTFLFAAFLAVRTALVENDAAPAGASPERRIVVRWGIGYVIAMLVYNITEATFKPLNFLFILFLLVTLRPHGLVTSRVLAPAGKMLRRGTGRDTAALNTPHRYVRRRKSSQDPRRRRQNGGNPFGVAAAADLQKGARYEDVRWNERGFGPCRGHTGARSDDPCNDLRAGSRCCCTPVGERR